MRRESEVYARAKARRKKKKNARAKGKGQAKEKQKRKKPKLEGKSGTDSYTHIRAQETELENVSRLRQEKKK